MRNMQSEGFFRSILVPVDEWFPSTISQEIAVFLAKKFGSKVTVIHVASGKLVIPVLDQTNSAQEILPIGAASGGFPRSVEISNPRRNILPEGVENEISNWHFERGLRVIGEAVERFKKAGVAFEEKLVEKGDPADIILSEAEKGNYDLIIMGNSGEEEHDQHLGSVARKVATHAEIPILINRGSVSLSNMLVPVDGSENSESAIKYADALVEKIDARMTLIYVQESPFLKLEPEVSREIGNRILVHAASKVSGKQPERILESGDPAKKIIETAKKTNIDLIVMSSRGHGTARRFLMGSVSDHVINYSEHSVLLVK